MLKQVVPISAAVQVLEAGQITPLKELSAYIAVAQSSTQAYPVVGPLTTQFPSPAAKAVAAVASDGSVIT
jgi:hypothetical protein